MERTTPFSSYSHLASKQALKHAYRQVHDLVKFTHHAQKKIAQRNMHRHTAVSNFASTDQHSPYRYGIADCVMTCENFSSRK